MAGDAETGVAVMRMEEGLDTGPVGLVERVAIAPDMTAGELHDRLMLVGADLMGRALAALEREALGFTPQPTEGVTYAAKIDKAESRIDWSRPAQAVHDHIRGLSPFPGAWFEVDGARVKVLRSTLASWPAAGHCRANCSTTRSPSPAATARCASSRCRRPAAGPCRRRSSCAERRSPRVPGSAEIAESTRRPCSGLPPASLRPIPDRTGTLPAPWR